MKNFLLWGSRNKKKISRRIFVIYFIGWEKERPLKGKKRIPEILNNNKVFVSSVHCSKCLILSEVSEIEIEREKKNFHLFLSGFVLQMDLKKEKFFTLNFDLWSQVWACTQLQKIYI